MEPRGSTREQSRAPPRLLHRNVCLQPRSNVCEEVLVLIRLLLLEEEAALGLLLQTSSLGPGQLLWVSASLSRLNRCCAQKQCWS